MLAYSSGQFMSGNNISLKAKEHVDESRAESSIHQVQQLSTDDEISDVK